MKPPIHTPILGWGDQVTLQGEYADEMTWLSYAFKEGKLTRVSLEFRLRFAGWKAARVGLYSFGSETGHADFDNFRFAYGHTLAECCMRLIMTV